MRRMLGLAVAAAIVAGIVPGGIEADTVPFDSDRWKRQGAVVGEHLGRNALTGNAFLPDAAFGDGVIEFDIALTGERGYPGIIFRARDMENYERFYIRPHRLGLYPDALQYVPSINGISGWQLYNGDGFTAGREMPVGKWVHLRLEVSGSRARLFVGDETAPALVMDHLKHGESSGWLGLMSSGSDAWFSNFSYREDDGLDLPVAIPEDRPPGVLLDWEISQVFSIGGIEVDTYPADQGLELAWRAIAAEPNGLVDIARVQKRTSREPDVVYARTVIHADEPRTMQLEFGYSDAVLVFLDGRRIFSGTSAYRQRDPSFLGIVGLFDTVYLPLERGENELVLLVAEGFGGWGFIARDAEAVFAAEGVERAWETPREFRTPESIVLDERRAVLYVTDYDQYRRESDGQAIAAVSLDGEILDPRWVGGLSNPLGMALANDRLWVVERGHLAEIDIENRSIVSRHPFPSPGFPNDVAAGGDGALYVTDSGKNAIYRFAGGEMSVWLSGEEISSPNGAHVLGNEVFWANNGDRRIKAAKIGNGRIRTIARLGEGVIDGIEDDGRGNLLVSHWQGRLYRIAPDGSFEKVLDTSAVGNIANFAFSPERATAFIPTYNSGRVIAYRLP
ncbi:MAG: SMP-30/gluconolactonase/LRE family protein [Candidatus Krumholzibacteriota bacterium]|nr:SMP-30/gluconolactonase/LRE family protein [Candidatus Krumholzibacteriota bacterium]